MEEFTVGETRHQANENNYLQIAKTEGGTTMRVNLIKTGFGDKTRTYLGVIDGADVGWTFECTDTFWVDVARP